jgi:hypothetical protein
MKFSLLRVFAIMGMTLAVSFGQTQVDLRTQSKNSVLSPITVGTLPANCKVGDVRYATDASFAAGSWTVFLCTATNIWTQTGMEADGTGYLTVTCALPDSCLVGPNTAVIPSLPGANIWLGLNDFSGGSKTALFRLAAAPPSTCDPASREAYFNTVAQALNTCTSTNTWTTIGSPHTSMLLYQKTGVAAVTATGSTQTLDSFVIPAGTLQVADVVEIQANFARTGTAAPIVFGVTFGGSAIPTSGVSTPAAATGAAYKPTLLVSGTAAETWGGTLASDGGSTFVVGSHSSAATGNISAPITVSLTQSGTGPDTGAVSSWFVKVTR